jgi:hypothetical protein
METFLKAILKMQYSFFFKDNHPKIYRFFSNLKNESSSFFSPFFFYGKTGKEFFIIKILQMLYCPSFENKDHEPVYCPICRQVNTLKEESGIFSIITAFNSQRFRILLEHKLAHNTLDPLTQEALVHKIHKIFSLFEIQLSKDTSSSKLSLKKMEGFVSYLETLEKSVINNSPFTPKQKDTLALFSSLEEISYTVPLNFVNNTIHKLSLKSHRLKYKVLIIKNPGDLSEIVLNRLLKIIEEPPQDLLIFFIAPSKKKVLPTILSRCLPFHFKNYSLDFLNKASQLFPSYPWELIKPQPFSFDSSFASNLSENQIVQGFEFLASELNPLAALQKEQKNVLKEFLLAKREYSINKKHLESVLEIFLERKKK